MMTEEHFTLLERYEKLARECIMLNEVRMRDNFSSDPNRKVRSKKNESIIREKIGKFLNQYLETRDSINDMKKLIDSGKPEHIHLKRQVRSAEVELEKLNFIPNVYQDQLKQLAARSGLKELPFSSSSEDLAVDSATNIYAFPENDAHIIPATMWGPGAWTFLESKHQWEDQFDAKGQESLYLILMQFVLPTLQCRQNFVDYLIANPPMIGSSKGEYIFKLHNAVNQRNRCKEEPTRYQEVSESDAKKMWAKSDLSNVNGQKRKNMIIFRSAVAYVRNSFFDEDWTAIQAHNANITEILKILKSDKLNELLRLENYDGSKPEAKLVRILSCRTSMFALYYIKNCGLFVLSFYSAIRDRIQNVFLPTEDSPASLTHAFSMLNKSSVNSMSLTTLNKAVQVKKLVQIHTVKNTHDLYVFEWVTSTPGSIVSFVFDLIEDTIISSQRFEYHEINQQDSSVLLMQQDPEFQRSSFIFFPSKYTFGPWNAALVEKLIDYTKFVRDRKVSYFPMESPIIFDKIPLRQYQHSIFDFSMDRLPGEDHMKIHKLSEDVTIHKNVDLVNKKISLHMLEDHWQTGLVLYYQIEQKMVYVPLNPYTNQQSSHLTLSHVIDTILKYSRRVVDDMRRNAFNKKKTELALVKV